MMAENTIFKGDKILKHLDRIGDWLKGKNPFAVTVELDVTNVCNHRCPGCCGFAVPNSDSLDLEKIKDVIHQISALGGKGLIFTGGGEPLCSPHIYEAVKFANVHCLDVGLITNGSLLHRGDYRILLNNCKWIRVSLDSGSASMFKRTHGRCDYHDILTNISNLISLRDNSEYDCTIGIGYLTGKGTSKMSDMKDFVRTAVRLGVDYAQFRPFLSYGKEDFHNFEPIDFDELKACGDGKVDVVTSEHKYNLILRDQVEREYRVCYGHQFATTICANGDMTICCHSRGIDCMKIGNIHEDSIHDIWNSEERRDAVEKIDLDKCPLLCRCDSFNKVLYDIKQDREHVNFL